MRRNSTRVTCGEIDHAVVIKTDDLQKMFLEPPWSPSDIIVFEKALAIRDKRARNGSKILGYSCSKRWHPPWYGRSLPSFEAAGDSRGTTNV